MALLQNVKTASAKYPQRQRLGRVATQTEMPTAMGTATPTGSATAMGRPTASGEAILTSMGAGLAAAIHV